MRRAILYGFLLLGLTGRIEAAMLGTGNVLVSELDGETVTEYTTGGVFVQSFSVSPTSEGVTSRLRDIVVDADGNIQAYNGTGAAELATINPVTSSVSTQTLSGLSTVNNGTYGGIAAFNNSVFLTDMNTSGAAEQGIVKFSTTGDPAVRFATGEEYEDLTMGIDGNLYALRNINDTVDVFDPVTDTLLRTIDFDATLTVADIRGISVDADGNLYLAGWNGFLYSADANGNTMASINSGFNDLTDIDIDNAGNLLAGSRFGNVIFSDTTLASVNSFTIASGDQVHVSFTDPLQIQSSSNVPEPGSLVLLGLTTCGIGLAASRRRKTAHQA